MTHTPGPWRVESKPIYGQRGDEDAKEWLVWGMGEYNLICSHLYNKADARLIAAAPALLAALEALIGEHGGTRAYGSSAPASVAARAAIQLAKGETE